MLSQHCLARIFFFVMVTLGFTSSAHSGQDNGVLPTRYACSAVDRFNNLNTLIRDGRIDRVTARREILSLLSSIKECYREENDNESGDWVFPLRGYGPAATAGGKGHGYKRGGYDFFDGNRHLGHPSYDIFIADGNRDARDDTTGNYVDVLAMTGGVVVASETSWDPGSNLRGGKYLWIYDPVGDALVYYAHNAELAVAVGDVVKPGDVIAHVGRTGFNAWKKRSPTHLHLTYLSIDGGRMTPKDIWPKLKKALVVKQRQSRFREEW